MERGRNLRSLLNFENYRGEERKLYKNFSGISLGNYRTIVSEKMLHFHLRSLEDCERFPSSRQFWTLVGFQSILLAMCFDDVRVSGFEIRKSCPVLPTFWK